MKPNNKRPSCAFGAGVFLFVLVTSPSLRAQAKSANPQAQAAYEAGVAAKQKGDNATAAVEFRKAVELDLHFIDAHIGYIDATVALERPGKKPRFKPTAKESELLKLYVGWLKKDRNYIMPGMYSLAAGLTGLDSGEHALVRACTLNPEVTSYLEKMAADVLQDDPRLAFEYASGYQHADPAQYEKTLQSIIARFPNDQVAMRALEGLAERAGTMPEKLALLGRIRADFAEFAQHPSATPVKADLEEDRRSGASLYNSIMGDLFGVYLKTDAAKALELAQAMAKANPEDKTWTSRLYLQQLILEKQGPSAAARPVVEQLETQLNVLRPKMSLWGDAQKTYDFLSRLVAESPGEPLQSALVESGKHLGKSPQQVDEDVWRVRTKDAKKLRKFKLSTYDGRKVNVADLRGKVVALNFWFPT